METGLSDLFATKAKPALHVNQPAVNEPMVDETLPPHAQEVVVGIRLTQSTFSKRV